MRMKLFFAIALFTAVTACASPFGGSVIQLTGQEATRSKAFASHREDVQLRQRQLQLEYQKQCNRLAEEVAQVDLDSQTFTFSLKKTHDLEPGTNYRLDESKAELVKQ